MSPRPISESKGRAKSRVFLILFGLTFFVAGCFAFWFVAVVPTTKTIAAKSWKQTECFVHSSRVEAHTSDDGTSYSPEITYEYTVNGRNYLSDQVLFIDMSASRSWAQSIVDEYPAGKTAVCYFDPQDPEQSVLNRDFSWGILLGYLTLLFVVAGIGIMWFGIFRYGKRKRTAVSRTSSRLVDQDVDGEAVGDFAEWEGPQRLRPASSRLKKLVGIAIFTILWNGFVSFFVVMASRDASFVVYLFMTPFVIAGIVLVFASIHQFLCLWNPVVEIALSNGAVELGSDVDVAWQLQGRLSRIRRLTVEIEAAEKATYTRGTKTYTDTEVFKTIKVVDTQDTAQMEFGSQSTSVPDDTMHTFAGDNNEVVWSIRVKGDIPWWPDINETYPFCVKPLESA